MAVPVVYILSIITLKLYHLMQFVIDSIIDKILVLIINKMNKPKFL